MVPFPMTSWKVVENGVFDGGNIEGWGVGEEMKEGRWSEDWVGV